MNIFAITATEYTPWIARSPKYAVLMVKMDDCIPCGRVYPTFKKMSRDFPDVQFATYDIVASDQHFVQNVLAVKNTPTFIVYHDQRVVLRVSSAKRIQEVKQYLLATHHSPDI